eukprot:203360-Chlamydomonas_euryale.AAC.3
MQRPTWQRHASTGTTAQVRPGLHLWQRRGDGMQRALLSAGRWHAEGIAECRGAGMQGTTGEQAGRGAKRECC